MQIEYTFIAFQRNITNHLNIVCTVWSFFIPAVEKHTFQCVFECFAEITVEISVDQGIQHGVEIANPEEYGNHHIRTFAFFAAQ